MTTLTRNPDIAISRCPQCGANLPPFGESTTCQYCGTNLVRPQRQGGYGQLHETVVAGVRLKPFTLTDAGTGMPVLQMLLPEGWQVQGGVTWNLSNIGMPATLAVQMYNPNGTEAFEVFPNMIFTWTNNPLTRMMSGLGGKCFGAEVRQPVPAQQMLREMLLPRHRSQVQGLRIVAEEHLPDLPMHIARSQGAAAADRNPSSWDGAKIRIQYTWGGHELEEEIYGAVEVYKVPIASLFGQMETIYWWADYLFSFRADAGALDSKAELYQAMAQSIRVNPQWVQAVQQTTQRLAQGQMQSIRQVGQMGQAYAQAGAQMRANNPFNTLGDELRQSNLQGFYDRSASQDRLSREWSECIRGVETYMDPNTGREVELPNTDLYAWSNPLGEYQTSSDPNYDPNVGDNRTWTPMQPMP